MSGSSYRPRSDNGSGDSPRPPFLSEFVNHIREVFFANMVYHLIGGALTMRVHPHVERPFRLKTESARRITKLQRAHAQVSQDSIRACGWNQSFQLCIRAMQQGDVRVFGCGRKQPFTGQLQRLRVLIEAKQTTLWAEATCDF